MKKITIILASIVLVLAILNGCMIGRTNPSSTSKEAYISRTKCSLIDAPINTENMENISGADVIWIAHIDGRYYGVGFFCPLGVMEQAILGRIDLYEYKFITSCPHSDFVIFDEKTKEVLRLTRENEEDFITEEQAKKLFDIAKNADWKSKVPETNADKSTTETN